MTARGTPSPLLISFGGLPACGKSTIAQEVARRLEAAYVRVDSIEVALRRAEGPATETNGWASPPSYEIARDVAADQLRVGRTVVADSVNPRKASRDAWRAVALDLGVRVLEVEVVCSDESEHRRRAEERATDVRGLALPTWQDIVNRDYERWDRARLVIDTALVGPHEAAAAVVATAGPGDQPSA